MRANRSPRKWGARIGIGMLLSSLMAIFASQALGLTQGKADFPPGYDAVAAAPNSHRVIFENALVRVLEVTMPPPGSTEPMHAIETVENFHSPTDPPLIRVEIKVRP